MVSTKIGIIAGIIVVVIIGVALGYSYTDIKDSQISKDSPQISDTAQIDIDATNENESFINEEGRKVIVIEAKDSLSIDD